MSFRSVFCWTGLACLSLSSMAHARDERAGRIRENGWSGELELDYDQSRARTDALRTGFGIEWGNPQAWIQLSGDIYGGLPFQSGWLDDSYLTLELGYALYRNNDNRLYLNGMLEVEPHSLLADRGWDLTPSLGIAWGITDDWWIGGEIGGVLATRPDDGNRMGYASLSLWVTWLSGFTAAGTDALAFGIWAASNEVPGEDNALFAGLEYSFDFTESLEAKIAVGTDVISPWDHQGVYLTAGLTWHF